MSNADPTGTNAVSGSTAGTEAGSIAGGPAGAMWVGDHLGEALRNLLFNESHENNSDGTGDNDSTNDDTDSNDDCANASNVNNTKRSSDGRLRNPDGTFANDGGPTKTPNPMHGNTKTPDTQATLYGKFDSEGKFLKWGKSQDPQTRYTSKELNGGFVKEYRTGPTDKILDRERRLTERFPGPENNEPWAGSKRPK